MKIRLPPLLAAAAAGVLAAPGPAGAQVRSPVFLDVAPGAVTYGDALPGHVPPIRRQSVEPRKSRAGQFFAAAALSAAGSFVGLAAGAGIGSEYGDRSATAILGFGGSLIGASAGAGRVTHNRTGAILGGVVGLLFGVLVTDAAEEGDDITAGIAYSLAHGFVAAAVAMPGAKDER